MANRATERKPQGALTQSRSKRGKCANCQKRESTMLHWRAYDLGIIPWPDVCEKCWDDCDRAYQQALKLVQRL